jgi:hypothetical protein
MTEIPAEEAVRKAILIVEAATQKTEDGGRRTEDRKQRTAAADTDCRDTSRRPGKTTN